MPAPPQPIVQSITGTLPIKGSWSTWSPVGTATAAQVNAMAVTEIDVVAAKPNFVLVPRLLLMRKASGAYTVVGVTSPNGLMFGWGTVANNLPIWCWANSPAFSPIVEAEERYWSCHGPFSNGTSGGLPYGFVFANGATVGVVGKKLALRSLGASPAGAGGALRFQCYYDAIPESFWQI